MDMRKRETQIRKMTHLLSCMVEVRESPHSALKGGMPDRAAGKVSPGGAWTVLQGLMAGWVFRPEQNAAYRSCSKWADWIENRMGRFRRPLPFRKGSPSLPDFEAQRTLL
jgi:hypothetical protein